MTASTVPEEWTRSGLEAVGFRGFIPFSALSMSRVPNGAGTYVVIAPEGSPAFLDRNPSGPLRGDPSVPKEVLERKWVPATSVVYIGSAGLGRDGRRGISKRLDEYRRHGAGEMARHWGGRYLWQLASSADLLVCWRESSGDESAEDVEAELLAAFELRFGRLPFANLKRGRRNR